MAAEERRIFCTICPEEDRAAIVSTLYRRNFLRRHFSLKFRGKVTLSLYGGRKSGCGWNCMEKGRKKAGFVDCIQGELCKVYRSW